jgi:adenosylmethionine-8-amino-7-oxononanoate aminotransferase
MNMTATEHLPDWAVLDRRHVWHPYSAMHKDAPVFPVVSANGVRIRLANGNELIDGMASWWCAIHGYNHPLLNRAITDQLACMSHVMFGGLTHEPASRLAATLVELSPAGLDCVFFADSGSVSVEVAMKMAIQYWVSLGFSRKNTFLTVRGGYHGDTFGAMSVCDPVTGMHSLYGDVLMQQVFVESPTCTFTENCSGQAIRQMELAITAHKERLAAVILEPVVQGAGGMRFYSPDYLRQVRDLCNQNDVLLIVDEIATGFGRTGKLFACEHAGISPDILCLGKALTGGYLTLAATLTTLHISQVISDGKPGVFMHGPTFMANPLACAVANASIELLLTTDWEAKVAQIQKWLTDGLKRCSTLGNVQEVRILGAIGVVELKKAVDMKSIQPAFVEQGVWIRPFGKLIYLMPPYIIEEDEVAVLTDAIFKIVENLE